MMMKLSSWKTIFFLYVFWAATAIASSAQTFTTLVSFNGSNGANPYFASLVQGLDGNFYGTTYSGGARNWGTVFKITPAGSLRTVYSFCAVTGCTDGKSPGSSLIQGTDGNFYGTTNYGGLYNGGIVFSITPGGILKVLYNFCSIANCTDGQGPYTGVIQASDGNFYGTTRSGGAYFSGSIFKVTPAGSLMTLYSFCQLSGCPDGRTPAAGLVQATDGNFYGTTSANGAHSSGTIFKITKAGSFKTLYNFCAQTNCTDGKNPVGTMIQARDGNLYGTASGGAYNQGTIFKATLAGAESKVYSFCQQAGCPDGSSPQAGVIQATDGNIYGTNNSGGANFVGTIFEVTLAGALTTLHNFCSQSSCTDGALPYGGLVQGTNGEFYGTTYKGGTNLDGTVFSLATGLGPFVETNPTSGKVGAKIGILGQGFTSSSIVKFGGVQATTVTLTGTTFLTATVPAGALTGSVTVTTGSTTLKSNKIFRVIPQITSFSPTSGPVGTLVTITGVSLKQTVAVTFGGVKASAVTVNSDTQVKATVPAGAKTGKIAITTPGGTATSATTFTVT